MSMAKKHISIRISGTPVKKVGFLPIVNINDAYFEMHDEYPQALTREASLYSVAILPDLTVYKLVFNRMRHSDGTVARLVIGFSVPAGYRLPSGTDAAGVLNMLLEAFLGNFAKEYPDGSFEFCIGRMDTSVFEKISTAIELCPSDERRMVMKEGAPRGGIEVPGDMIGATLDKIVRSGAEGVSELLVGEHLNMPLAGVTVALSQDDPSAAPASVDPVADSGIVFNDHGQECVSDNGAGVAAPVTPDEADTNPGDKQADNGQPLMSTSVLTPAGDDIVTDQNSGCQTVHARRRPWPALLTGILLGAAIATAVMWQMLKDKDQVAPTMANDTAVVFPADTVSPVQPETVYVEKKVIVEKPARKAARKSSSKPSATQAASSVPVQELSEPQETPQIPQLKYDPEAERSL